MADARQIRTQGLLKGAARALNRSALDPVQLTRAWAAALGQDHDARIMSAAAQSTVHGDGDGQRNSGRLIIGQLNRPAKDHDSGLGGQEGAVNQVRPSAGARSVALGGGSNARPARSTQLLARIKDPGLAVGPQRPDLIPAQAPVSKTAAGPRSDLILDARKARPCTFLAHPGQKRGFVLDGSRLQRLARHPWRVCTRRSCASAPDAVHKEKIMPSS